MRKLLLLSTLLMLGSITGTVASASAPACRQVFAQNNISNIVEKPPFEQWLIWEQEANFSIFRKSRAPVQVPVSFISTNDVNITFLDSATPALRKLIGNDQIVKWFKHPYNNVQALPHFHDKVDSRIIAYQTASRSLAVRIGNEFYTLKMATDRPHGPKGQYQPSKASTKEDIMDGINRMSYVERVDSEIGLDPQLLLAKEVAMVADKKTGEGYLFRDLSFMKSGNYYLPALSIPYVGREIAQHNGMTAEVFWKTAYAEILGRSKAKLLLRYGAQMETPNSQNMLIELDGDLKPTGRMVFRDISDTILITGVAEGLGEQATLEKDKAIGVENGNSLQPYWSNSAWRFNEAGDKSFSDTTLVEWGQAHDNAYKAEIEKALNVDLSQFTSVDNNPEFNTFMTSEIVQKKLRDYRSSLMKKMQQVPVAI